MKKLRTVVRQYSHRPVLSEITGKKKPVLRRGKEKNEPYLYMEQDDYILSL
jgi:hypothetical protein